MSEFEKKWEKVKAENEKGDYGNGEAWTAGNGMKVIERTNFKKREKEVAGCCAK